MFFRKRDIFNKYSWKHWNREIDPDEIFLDSSNLPNFDQSQFEGRFEKPLSRFTVFFCATFFLLLLVAFSIKISMLQVQDGDYYLKKSQANSLRKEIIFPSRGIIYDRNNIVLASNVAHSDSLNFSHRIYAPIPGVSHILGYVRYPAKDSSGYYYQNNYEGIEGVEKIYDDTLAGVKGLQIVETDVYGKSRTGNIINSPRDGETLTLSIDSRINKIVYKFMQNIAKEIGFVGGAVAIMDVKTGELLTLVNFPEYDSNILSDHTDNNAIGAFINSKQLPFLNRAVDGLYTPGSIVKPFVAMAALEEGVIDPQKKILSTGSISIPNPFDPTKKSIFRDWRAQGYVDMREAIAVSSDVYFYEIGGGFENQPGLGISRMEKYMRLFGFGESLINNPLLRKRGIIPNPNWKKQNFTDGRWRVGDTYNTAIGQYGFQVTLLQVLRATASLSNDGILTEPTLLKPSAPNVTNEPQVLPFKPENFQVIREGMRQSVQSGTAAGLNIPQVTIAAKTGTAELGTAKQFVNSWVIGFFPYEKPRYAFVAIVEKGPRNNTIGALYVMRELFLWMANNTPEYLKSDL